MCVIVLTDIGAGAGLGLPIIGKLLGHAQANTIADPLRRASDRIGNRIAAVGIV